MVKGRVKLEIDKDEFQKVIATLEANHTFEKLGDLWEAVENTEWAKIQVPRPLTAPVAYQRAKELGIQYKTTSGKVGKYREKLEIDKDEFQKVIAQLESEQTFTKLSDLWKAVEETDWAKNQKPRPLSAAVAYQRYKEFGIDCKTKPARKTKTNNVAGETPATFTEEKPAVPVYINPQNVGVPHFRGFSAVSTPAGDCPHRLTGTDEDTVLAWCDKVIATRSQTQGQILPTALAYYASQFYPIRSDELELVKDHIQSNKDILYSNFGEEAE